MISANFISGITTGAKKWRCEVDGREVHDCFEPIPTEQDQAKTPNKSPNCIGGGKRRRLAWKESCEQSQRIDTDKISRSAGDKQTLHVRWKSSPDAMIIFSPRITA